MRRTAVPLLGLILLTGIALVGGCSRRETPVAIGNRTQVLHVGVGSDPNDLDPQLVSSNRAAAISMALGEGLTNYDPADLHPVPGVAERWEVSADGLVYTFHLRADAKWSNGEPLVASDFVFSAQRILSPRFAGEFAYYFFPIRGAEDFHFGRTVDFSTVGVSAPDAHTVRYELHQPAPYFPTLVAHWSWYPVHPATILQHGKIDEPFTAWTQPGHFVGNGPFQLVEWRTGQGAVVKRNPHYWDAARVRLAEIDFHFIGDADAEERAFRGGQLHITMYVPPSKLPAYRVERPEQLRLIPLYSTDWLCTNLTRPALNDRRVRQALSLAIDRATLANRALLDGSSPAVSLVPPMAGGYQPPHEAPLRYDPAEARHLLAEAGFPDGRGFPHLTISTDNSTRNRVVAETVQQMWHEALGIEVGILARESRIHIESQHRHDFDFSIAGWLGDYLDPLTFLDTLLSSSGHNDPLYRSADYDRLVSEGAGLAALSERYARFQAAEAMVLRDLPLLPLFHRTTAHLVDPAVRGYEANLMDMHPYTAIYLAAPH